MVGRLLNALAHRAHFTNLAPGSGLPVQYHMVGPRPSSSTRHYDSIMM